MDTGQLSSTRTPACSLLSTVPLVDTASCDFPLVWSAPKTSSRKRWIRSSKNAKDVLELQMTSPYMATPRQNMMPTYEISCKLHLQIWLGVQPTEDACESPSRQFLWMPLWCQWSPPRPRQGQCCTCLASTHQHHWTPRILRSSHVPKSLHTWSIHLDCPSTAPLRELLKKDTDFSWNRTYDIAFEQVKEAVISDTTLRYFDPSLPMTIQVDASQVGLGAALLQNGKPVAFASKALTKTECQYANIERERC